MKKYTIKDAAEIMKVPASTIRYYDKEGLLPFVGRDASGYRVFTEKDLATLRVIDCLKKTGMSAWHLPLSCLYIEKPHSATKRMNLPKDELRP